MESPPFNRDEMSLLEQGDRSGEHIGVYHVSTLITSSRYQVDLVEQARVEISDRRVPAILQAMAPAFRRF
jgi:hypothetical protein